MRFKIPCKKRCYLGMTGLLLVILLLLVSLSVQASEVANKVAREVTSEDRALFWSLHKEGKSAGYLLGTIHSEDPRVLDFSLDFLEKLRENSVFAMELVPDMATLARLTEYMHYPTGTTLESVIGQTRYAALVSAMSVYKVPADFINRMKPWAAMMTLSTPPPETGFFMDLSISLRASGSGLKTIGLETLEQQLSFLQEMPLEMQLELLDQAIAEFAQVKQAHDEMVDAYLKNNLQELWALSDEQLATVSGDAGEYFMEFGIRARNLRMAESLWPYLESNRVFIAVGALHLPSDDGLINLLRLKGYKLKPLAMPFTVDSAIPDR